MFNCTLQNEAKRIHKTQLENYDASYKEMANSCEHLYEVRVGAVGIIKQVEQAINSIANTPKEFDTKLGKISRSLTEFKNTECYAKDACEASLAAGINIVGGAVAGLSIAAAVPTVWTNPAAVLKTTYTDKVIETLSYATAQKTISGFERNFTEFAIKETGMMTGNPCLASAAPIGWSFTVASIGISLLSLSVQNKQIADKLIHESKEIAKSGEYLNEISKKVDALAEKMQTLEHDISKDRDRLIKLMKVEYFSLKDDEKIYLGTLVNNTLSLSKLLNETVN